MECTFTFSHATFSICPLSFPFPHPTSGIVVASFRIRTFTRWSSIDGDRGLNSPDPPPLKWRSRVGRETFQWSGLRRPSPLPTTRRQQTCSPPCDKSQDVAAPVDCKTVRIFAYSSTREQSNKRCGTRLKTESETGERRYGRVRLARFARVRLLRHALPISLLILRKKPTVLQSTAPGD